MSAHTKYERYEHTTGRCVVLLLAQIFRPGVWSTLPQMYTQTRDFPDLVLETYTRKRKEFIPKIFIELKSTTGDSIEKAMDQVTRAIQAEYFTNKCPPKGYLIAVRGSVWEIHEYNFVNKDIRQPPRGGNPQRKQEIAVTLGLDSEVDEVPHRQGKPTRPTSLSTGPVDIREDQGFKYIVDLLTWMAKSRGRYVRDFVAYQGEKLLPTMHSVSTFESEKVWGNLSRDDQEEPGEEEPGKEESAKSFEDFRAQGFGSNLGSLELTAGTDTKNMEIDHSRYQWPPGRMENGVGRLRKLEVFQAGVIRHVM